MMLSQWRLESQDAARLRAYQQSDAFQGSAPQDYDAGRYWSALAEDTFVAVRGTRITVHSGHAFRRRRAMEGATLRSRLQHAAVGSLASAGWLVGALQRAGYLATRLAQEADAARMAARGRRVFAALRSGSAAERRWEIPAALQRALPYNEHKVYDSVENLALIRRSLEEAPAPRVVLELGAGAGLTSLGLLASWPGSRVIICDLPETISVSFTLLSTFGEGRYRTLLPHEATPEQLAQGAFDLAFLTPAQLPLVGAGSVSGALNVHSMQEMEMATVQAYFREIRRVLRPQGFFFCKNFAVSRQYPATQFDAYPWDAIGPVAWDGVAAYSTQTYGKPGEVVRARIVRSDG